MAPVDENSIIVYGGIEDGMDRCGYDDDGNPIDDPDGPYLGPPVSDYVDSEEDE